MGHGHCRWTVVVTDASLFIQIRKNGFVLSTGGR